jgi:hypothetical protein
MTYFSQSSDLKPLKLVTYVISADRKNCIEIGWVAKLKIKKPWNCIFKHKSGCISLNFKLITLELAF